MFYIYAQCFICRINSILLGNFGSPRRGVEFAIDQSMLRDLGPCRTYYIITIRAVPAGSLCLIFFFGDVREMHGCWKFMLVLYLYTF